MKTAFSHSGLSSKPQSTCEIFETKNNGGWAVYADGERLTPNCFTSREIAHEFIHAYRNGTLTSAEFFERRASMPQDDWGW